MPYGAEKYASDTYNNIQCGITFRLFMVWRTDITKFSWPKFERPTSFWRSTISIQFPPKRTGSLPSLSCTTSCTARMSPVRGHDCDKGQSIFRRRAICRWFPATTKFWRRIWGRSCHRRFWEPCKLSPHVNGLSCQR